MFCWLISTVLLKKLLGMEKKKDHHQEKDQGQWPPLPPETAQLGRQVRFGGPQHCPGRATCRCSERYAGYCKQRFGRGGPRKSGSRPNAAVYPSFGWRRFWVLRTKPFPLDLQINLL